MPHSKNENDLLVDEARRGNSKRSYNNPYVTECIELKNKILTPSEVKTKYPIFRGSNHPLVIEIGSYLGETVLDMATHNPEVNFLAIDIVFKRVVKTARRIERAGLSNVLTVIGDGLKLIESLPNQSLDGACIFYSDPWENKTKHRVINARFFSVIKSKLTYSGFIWIKTDHSGYFSEIEKGYRNAQFNMSNRFPSVLTDKPYYSFFETLFRNQNRQIFQGILMNEHYIEEGR